MTASISVYLVVSVSLPTAAGNDSNRPYLLREMTQIVHTSTGRHPFVVTSDIVALQVVFLVVVSALLSVQESVIVVHGFGFRHVS